MKNIEDLFKDKNTIKLIKEKLPKLFHLAELESSRAGKVGMEVGTIRERIVVALLIYKFGDKRVKSDIPTTEAEVDVIIDENPISIKSITSKGNSISGIKLIWTVDHKKALEFQRKYSPDCDIILIHINWNEKGGFYLIPKNIQKQVFLELGKDRYIKLPAEGTNPRGVEMSKEAINVLIHHSGCHKVDIEWKKDDISFNPFYRWIDLWREKK